MGRESNVSGAILELLLLYANGMYEMLRLLFIVGLLVGGSRGAGRSSLKGIAKGSGRGTRDDRK